VPSLPSRCRSTSLTDHASFQVVRPGGYSHLDFLKTTKVKPDRPPKDEVKPKQRQVVEDAEDDDRLEQAIANRNRRVEKPLFARDEEVTTVSVCAKLSEILAARGRKGTSPADQMALLSRLRQVRELRKGVFFKG
jgi:hypothetical protein